jgi:hypothetical protein
MALRLPFLPVAVCLAVSVSGCDSTETAEKAAPDRDRQDPSGSRELAIDTRLPPGWDETERPLTNLVNPEEVLTVSSFELRPPFHSDGCAATGAAEQIPEDGVLIQILHRTGKAGTVEGFDERAPGFVRLREFRRGYECMGPGYNVFFRRGGYVFQAWVGTASARLSPRVRRQAEGVLNTISVGAHPRRHPAICLSGNDLQTSGGEALAAAAGQSAAPLELGERRRRSFTRRIFEGAFAPSVRGDLKWLEGRSLSGDRNAIDRVTDAAMIALQEVRAHPTILLDKRQLAATFSRARHLAESFGYSRGFYC